jgi:type IV secretory pathway VirJ component
VGDSLASNGVAGVGFDSHRYLREQRTPEIASHDLERVCRHCLSVLGKKKIALIGYSRGADTACPALDTNLAILYEMPGCHHFDREYGEIASTILGRVTQEPAEQRAN